MMKSICGDTLHYSYRVSGKYTTVQMYTESEG